ncbi:MAG TPA: signal recognition particle receptor subunit alpha [archaeon]|nr:signal recognition particle receptor subunit alpha [archaeon]
MLEKLGQGLRAALDKITRAGYVDANTIAELVKDIQRTLLAGDVDVKLVSELSQRIKKRALDEKPPAGMSAREHIVRIVYEELVAFLGKKPEIKIGQQKILLCGLFGNGKTTTAAKLAKFFQKKGLKVGLICCDVVRPAAYEQLQQLSEQLHVDFFGIKNEKDSSKVLSEGLRILKSDVIIIDSSGRDALNSEMISEIKSLNKIANPEERLLVISADVGQAARVQAEKFHEAVGITGVIITKMDATAKGGGALTACSVTRAPVKFITVGEKIDALEIFEPERFISRLIGFGDLQSLLEKAREAIPEKKAEALAEKMLEGKFSMDDFLEQIEAMGKMGGLGSIMSQIPGMGGMKLPKEFDVAKQEGKMKKWKFAIQSMTRAERADPTIVDSKRILRISKGSGVSEAEVRELLKNYEQARKMMKMMGGGGLKRGPLGRLARKFKGFG